MQPTVELGDATFQKFVAANFNYTVADAHSFWTNPEAMQEHTSKYVKLTPRQNQLLVHTLLSYPYPTLREGFRAQMTPDYDAGQELGRRGTFQTGGLSLAFWLGWIDTTYDPLDLMWQPQRLWNFLNTM